MLVSVLVCGLLPLSGSIGIQTVEEIHALVPEIDAAMDAGDGELARGLLKEIVDEMVPGLLELSGDSLDVPAALLQLDDRGRQLGSLRAQVAIREAMVEWLVRNRPWDELELLRAKQNLAVVVKEVGQLARAIRIEEEVLLRRQELLPPHHAETIAALSNLGGSYCNVGDLVAAQDVFERAVASAVIGGDPSAGRLTANLANVRALRGNPMAARRLYEALVEEWEVSLGEDHPDLLRAKANLALTKEEMGDSPGARRLLEEVVEALEGLRDPAHPELIRAKRNLASVLISLGDLEGALAIDQGILAQRAGSLPADHPELIVARTGLASTLRRMGDLIGARELEVEALETARRTLPAEHPFRLVAEMGLATTWKKLGELGKARELEEGALATRLRVLPPGHQELLAAGQNLAITRWEMGEFHEAALQLRTVMEWMRTRAIHLSTESVRAAREGARRELEYFNVLLLGTEFADPEARFERDLLETLETLRLVSTGGGAAVLAANRDLDLRQLRSELSALGTRIGDLGAAPPKDFARVRAWEKELSDLASARDRLQFELRNELSERGVRIRQVELDDVVRELRPGASLVSYFRYPQLERLDSRPSEEPGTVDSVVAFVMRPDCSVERIELGAVRELEHLALSWRASLGVSARARGVGKLVASSAPDASAGEALRQRLVDPVLAATSSRTLYVILDDFMHLLPLDALPLDGGLVGDRYDLLFHVSVARLLNAREPELGEGATLIGGVDYDRRQESGTPSGSSQLIEARYRPDAATRAAAFEPLPGAGAEVEAIARLFGDAGLPLEKLVGEWATKAALRDRVRGTRFVHLSSHGWFAPETLAGAFEANGAAERPVRDAKATLWDFAPETLCGLALAGANLGMDEVGRVPGIITAEEMSSLDLAGCELAVLSACETSVGLRHAGQGIRSLQAALHAAGARTAITSMWKVDDAATCELFERFYTHLLVRGHGKARALWAAKSDLRGAGHPPRDWAGWILTGER